MDQNRSANWQQNEYAMFSALAQGSEPRYKQRAMVARRRGASPQVCEGKRIVWREWEQRQGIVEQFGYEFEGENR